MNRTHLPSAIALLFFFSINHYSTGQEKRDLKKLSQSELDSMKRQNENFKKEQETRKQWAKMDSVEIASLPDSIKQRPAKEFPKNTSIVWTVRGLYDPTLFNKYKRPAYPPSTYYNKDTSAYHDPGDDNRIWYTCMVSDLSRGEEYDAIGRLIYYRMKDSKQVIFYEFEKFYKKEEAELIIPASVLKMIKSEMLTQSKESISSFNIISHSEARVHRSIYSGQKDKVWIGNEKIEDKVVYEIWGTKPGDPGSSKPAFFTLKGEYIPNVSRDRCCNSTIKVLGKGKK